MVPDGARPGAIVAEVTSHVADAARTIAMFVGEPFAGDEDDEATVLSPALNFAWVAASALAAIPRFRPSYLASCRQKDDLLTDIDRDAAGVMEADPDWAARAPDAWLREVTGSLAGATSAVHALQDRPYDEFALPEATDDDHSDDAWEELVDSLREVALRSVLAVQAFEALHLDATSGTP